MEEVYIARIATVVLMFNICCNTGSDVAVDLMFL
jgi:hypothetical protein